MRRRDFLKSAAASTVAAAARLWSADMPTPSPRPNILWITCEDMSPNLGCYGDSYALTPNLDAFARQSIRYDRAFAMAGVCAPSRSCLITGMSPASVGSHHMRCEARLPEQIKCFSEYLRRAGFYCSNNSKTDYNFAPPRAAWDECSDQAHWRKRALGQSFFAVFNFMETHESGIWPAGDDSTKLQHDPAKAIVPPFHPDAPMTRRCWAQAADKITAMDEHGGQILRQLDEDGLAEDTIVFFFSDHGVGLPRGKRWLYDTGIRVPLLIRFPRKFAHLAPAAAGATTDRLVAFMDFGPTVLNLATVPIPSHMQGRPFLGPSAPEPRQFIHAIRDRMDEYYDCSRAVRDGRFKYIRNFMPYLRHLQPLEYQEKMPLMQEWRRLAAEGKLSGPAAIFMRPTKPLEELYDAEADPHEINNLAAAPEHAHRLADMRAELRRWMLDTHDTALLPEALMHERSAGRAFYDVAGDPKSYALARLLDAADLMLDAPRSERHMIAGLQDADAAVRYWCAIGLSLSSSNSTAALDALRSALKDAAPIVRVAAADVLRHLGGDPQVLPTLVAAMSDENEWVRLFAANAMQRLGEGARSALQAARRAAKDKNSYVVRVANRIVTQLGELPAAQ